MKKNLLRQDATCYHFIKTGVKLVLRSTLLVVGGRLVWLSPTSTRLQAVIWRGSSTSPTEILQVIPKWVEVGDSKLD